MLSRVTKDSVILKTASPVQVAERRRTAYEREFYARLRPLARYQPQPEHEVFVEGLLLEARLRARLLVRCTTPLTASNSAKCRKDEWQITSPSEDFWKGTVLGA